MAEQPQVHASVARRRKHVSLTTLLVSLSLTALVAFALGTRSNEIYALVAPVFGVKVVAGNGVDTALLQQTYALLKQNYDGTTDGTALSDGAARGMVAAAGDRYTVFMDKKETTAFMNSLNGQIAGVGCEIGTRSDQPTILRIVPSSPAEQAGLKVGDVFISVNDESVYKADSATVAEKVRGEKGTSVKIKVKRGSELKDFAITRAELSDPSVRSSVDGDIGTLTISRFDNQTATLARQAAQSFKDQGVKAVILDLRDDGGGYVDAAQSVAGMWLDKKLLVTEKKGDYVVDQVTTDGNPILAGMRTVVLVNGDSASASEIVAGAFQEYGTATIIGQKTFGKGSVQKMIDLPDGRMLKVTIAKWYTPKGKNITKEGISPDKTVPLTAEDTNAGRDPQMDAARQAATS